MFKMNKKRKVTNWSVAWIDYKNAYDMVPHTCILQCLKIIKAADNIRNVIENPMKNWNVELKSGRKTLGEVKINKGIFQVDSLLPILFVISLIPLSVLLRDMKTGHLLEEFREKINHLLFVDDLKI